MIKLNMKKYYFSQIIAGFIFFIFLLQGLIMAETEKAVFAGGCFWCMQPPFEKVAGVTSVFAGYTGGKGENPTYEDYAEKGFVEAVEVTFDPAKVSYSKLLDIFWHQIDPTDAGGQFVDRGPQYRSAIFYLNETQKLTAQKSKEALGKSGIFKGPIVTEILKASKFFKAEEYHQDYHSKNPVRYKFYRYRSGRDQFLQKTWKGREIMENNKNETVKSGFVKPDKEELKKKLTALQYRVTQENGTEPAFHNEYWNNEREGIYVDIVSGEPLFSSTDKFESGTGWPSFTKTIEPGVVNEKIDKGFFTTRTEIRSLKADSHLGHVFNDGPAPTGLRYCMNSAALKFIPKEDLKKEGYEKYLSLFKKK